MALYLIAFHDEWVPDLTPEQLREAGRAGRGVCDQMTAAGVFVVSDGALDASTVVCSVDPSSGTPLFTDGPFVETKEHRQSSKERLCLAEHRTSLSKVRSPGWRTHARS